MKLRIISIFIFLAVFSLTSHISFAKYSELKADCTLLKSSCEYYLCSETQKQCGQNGYLRSFGHKYCQRYQDQIKKSLSLKGKIWLSEVKSCLINELVNMNPNLSCGELKKQAFKSHVPCYKKTNFCQLSFSDKYKITKAAGRALRNPQIIMAGLKVLNYCY